MVNIINCTPHSIKVMVDGKEKVFYPCDNILRVKTWLEEKERIDGIPIYAQTFGDVPYMMQPQEGTYYIVSSIVQQALPKRKDLIVPVDEVRNDAGQIVECQGFAFKGERETPLLNLNQFSYPNEEDLRIQKHEKQGPLDSYEMRETVSRLLNKIEYMYSMSIHENMTREDLDNHIDIMDELGRLHTSMQRKFNYYALLSANNKQ